MRKVAQAAYALSGYGDPSDPDSGLPVEDDPVPDVSGLYELCAGTDPADPHNDKGFAAGPLPAKELEADGRPFHDGTYLVESEVKPGTHVVTDENLPNTACDSEGLPSSR
ncbi:hypothetical protein ACQPZJ_50670 [Actinoplanes sp. CA-054009]